jgi:superfamily II DNA/RNA helicase
MTVSFTDLGVPADLAAVLARKGITAPFPIQEYTVPDALQGLDVTGRAPTGSGKTIAFGLAVAAQVTAAKPKRPTALILAPTRELAEQIKSEVEPLAAARGRKVAAVYGGTGYGAQQSALRRGVDILVACPGRLEDLIQRRDVDLSDVHIVVLDEADRMADMGFLPVVRRLFAQVRPDRQTLLFSATLDGEVEKVAREYQNNPVRHEAVAEERSVGNVTHYFWRCKPDSRVDLLVDVVLRTGTVIAFCRTRHGVDRLAKKLNQAGVGAANLHGGRSQSQRDRALAAFQSGRMPVLCATDVAARGIHVDEVSCVVHFDPPADKADYIHRSGRTGRAGEDGLVVSFVGKQDEHAVRKLISQLKVDVEMTSVDLDLLGEVKTVRVDGKRPAIVEQAAADAVAETELKPPGESQRDRRDGDRPRRDGSKPRHRDAGRPQQRDDAKPAHEGNREARPYEPRDARPADTRGDATTREHHKHQQSNRTVHTNGTPEPKAGKPTPGKAAAAKLRHKRRKRAVGA